MHIRRLVLFGRSSRSGALLPTDRQNFPRIEEEDDELFRSVSAASSRRRFSNYGPSPGAVCLFADNGIPRFSIINIYEQHMRRRGFALRGRIWFTSLIRDGERHSTFLSVGSTLRQKVVIPPLNDVASQKMTASREWTTNNLHGHLHIKNI